MSLRKKSGQKRKTKNRRLKTAVALCAVIAAAALCFAVFALYGGSYERDEETVFSLLQITDVHIVNDEKKDAKAFKTIDAMIEETGPDMIVVTGDITSEYDNLTAIKKFSEYMEKKEIPWAFTFGNHDAEGAASKQEISDYLETLEYCIYERGDESITGMGNYYYTVRDENGGAVMSLIMMDSNMYPDEALNVEGYDKFHDDQVQWYRDTIKEIALTENGDETKVVPSLAFFHIPLYEFTQAYNEAKENKEIISGCRLEKECGPYEDDGMFEAMLEMGSTKGVFVGHDHMNSYSVNYRGIRLTYGNSCDHNIYFVPFRGGKLIEIKDDGSFTVAAVVRHRFTNTAVVGAAK